MPTEAMGSLAVRVEGRCKAPSVGMGTELRSVYRVYSIQYSEQYTL